MYPTHGPLTSYVKLQVAHAPGMPGTFPRYRFQRKSPVSIPGMHHGTCVTHVPWCMSGSLIRDGGEKRSRHSRRMRNPQFNISGKRPIAVLIWYPADDDLEIGHLTLVAITVITVWVPYYIIQVTATHLKISSQCAGFDIWKNFHLPNFQNLAFFNTHNIWFWRKFCPNPHPLAQLAVLLSPDRQAEGYVESWNKLFLMPVLQMCCSDSD